MDLIELIFKLVKKFVPISMEDYGRMYNEADEWRSKLNPDSNNKFEQMYVKSMTQWYVRLAISVSYIPFVRYIMDIQKPTENEEETEIFS